jgi:hypothetical protein
MEQQSGQAPPFLPRLHPAAKDGPISETAEALKLLLA